MKLLLVFLMGMVFVGLYTERLDIKTNLLIVMGIVVTTVLYYGFQRFMSI